MKTHEISYWIADTRKKFSHFMSPAPYLTVALAHLDRLIAENKMLRAAIQDFKSDIDSAGMPDIITYERDHLSSWLEHVLNAGTDPSKKETQNDP